MPVSDDKFPDDWRPDIELPAQDGSVWKLADYVGQTVVLIFHRHIH